MTAITNRDVPAALPNQTLFISNLDVKINKEDLRRSLYCLFSTYGPVLDVVALKTPSMRGTAHVVYRDVPTSTQAMRALSGSEFLGREMSVTYAKSKSNIISRLDGSAKTPDSSKTTIAASTMNESQKSIFSNPHAALPANPSLPAKPPAPKTLAPPLSETPEAAPSPKGVKRPREDESDEDVEMEAESDDGEAMDESDDE